MANSSQELGNGLADVLFGDYNPAGRTCQTWPKSPNDIPPMMDYNIRTGALTCIHGASRSIRLDTG